jgi:hypothetical protein
MNPVTDLTDSPPIGALGEQELILSDEPAVVLCTSIDSKYLIVKLQSSPADCSTEICKVPKFTDTGFLFQERISSFDLYYRFSLAPGGMLLVRSDFLYCAKF